MRRLLAAQEATLRTARKLFPVDAANDQPTADLLTRRLEVHAEEVGIVADAMEYLTAAIGAASGLVDDDPVQR